MGNEARVFEGDLEALKRRAKEFHDMSKDAQNMDELRALWKCFGLSYLEFNPKTDVEDVSARALLTIMGREYMARETAMMDREKRKG